MKKIHDAVVTRQTDFGHGYLVVEFACPELAATIDVGQFINIRVRDETTPLLRRPFSVFDVLRDASGKPTGISVLYHTIGTGTRLMSRWKGGERVSLSGPLGKTYPWPQEEDASVVMVGGGIGLAPFLLQAKRFMKAAPQRDYLLIAGGRSERDLKYMKLFSPLVAQGLNMLLCTNDGSLGVRGMVTDPLRGEITARLKEEKKVAVYCCGPTPMMSAVSALCAEFEVPCLVSLESVMACGYGVCNGCVTAVKDPSEADGFRYVKTCVEGPGFDGALVCWDKV